MPRYYNILADFSFTAEHRAGRLNQPDDTISRRSNLPEMDKFEKDMHSERSFLDQLTSNVQISKLEELEDISMEFADPFPAVWTPTNTPSMPSLPQDLVRSDIDDPTPQNAACFDVHPKLMFLNEIQNKYRGVVGSAN